MLKMQNDKKRLSPEEILAMVKKRQNGRLKIYIGAAPGVGKTFHMLRDAHDLKAKNVDIVIGLIETHGRTSTAAEIKNLEIIPKKTSHYKGRELQELDVESIINRNPDVVIVDELAHTNVPGSKNKKRYEDINELLEAGVDVWTAVNIQHLESVRDIVERITGIQVNERVPDVVLREADEVEVIDISPETLRDRIQEGKIYSKDKVQQSLNHFFRRGNLVALRELALREVADDIDLRLEKERTELGMDQPSGSHEKILVCIQYGPNAEKLIRRGWRIADRLNAELYVLHIHQKNISEKQQKVMEDKRRLAEQFGATFIIRETQSKKVAEQIVKVCQRHQITQIIIGMSARTRWEEIWKGSIIHVIMNQLKYVDVLIVSDR
jgi:two-component system sensor histidine kinase KdpD